MVILLGDGLWLLYPEYVETPRLWIMISIVLDILLSNVITIFVIMIPIVIIIDYYDANDALSSSHIILRSLKDHDKWPLWFESGMTTSCNDFDLMVTILSLLLYNDY